MKVMQERMGANVKEMKAEMRVINEGTVVSRMGIHQTRTVSTQEMKTKMDSHHEKFMAIKKAGHERIEAMMEACLEKTEATDLGANPEEIKSVVEHQKASKEETLVEIIGALEDRYGNRYLALRRRRQLRKLTQDEGGLRIKMATACRRMTRDAIPAQCKGHCRQGTGRGNVARGAPKGWTLERRRWTHLECNKGIKDRGARRQLRLRKERVSNRIFRKTGELEIKKRTVMSSTGLQEVCYWTLWRGRPPPKRKKRRQKRNPR
jgi:hypothetical protein